MAEDWLVFATRSLRTARRDHFLTNWDLSTQRLHEGVEQLRLAIREIAASPQPVPDAAALRQTIQSWRQELRIAEASHAHAQGWSQQWMQTLQSSVGSHPGYTRSGAAGLSTQPLRISVEG